jgi:hypothetical protein
MSIFSDNTTVKTIDLEDKILRVDDHTAYFTDSSGSSSSFFDKLELDSEFKVSSVQWNRYPNSPKLQRLIEPNRGIFAKVCDYFIKNDSFSVTYRGARKIIHISDLLKPEAFELFRICGNIPEGLIRIGIHGLQILPESIPDDINNSVSSQGDLYKMICGLMEEKVQSYINDDYKATFKIDRVYALDWWRCGIDCSFELESINGEPVCWWGWSDKTPHSSYRFNLRQNKVKIYWEFELKFPDFDKLRIKYKNGNI